MTHRTKTDYLNLVIQLYNSFFYKLSLKQMFSSPQIIQYSHQKWKRISLFAFTIAILTCIFSVPSSRLVPERSVLTQIYTMMERSVSVY